MLMTFIGRTLPRSGPRQFCYLFSVDLARRLDGEEARKQKRQAVELLLEGGNFQPKVLSPYGILAFPEIERFTGRCHPAGVA
jgi:hypothetical protein